MSEQNQVQFAPFVAINQFMLPEYRQSVIEAVLKQLSELPSQRRSAINSLIRRYVKISGFRNSDLAPLPIKVHQSGAAFERHSDFVAQILEAWAELNHELRQQVHELLTARQWEVLTEDADRSKLPGFLVRWPKQETYDVLDSAFHEQFPEREVVENDIRLMVVWVSGRLPFDMVDDEPEE